MNPNILDPESMLPITGCTASLAVMSQVLRCPECIMWRVWVCVCVSMCVCMHTEKKWRSEYLGNSKGITNVVFWAMELNTEWKMLNDLNVLQGKEFWGRNSHSYSVSRNSM